MADTLKYLDEILARCDAATVNPELVRYDHGGGRSFIIEEGRKRELVADYYGEANREFYHHARTDLPKLEAVVRVAYDHHGPAKKDHRCVLCDAFAALTQTPSKEIT